MAGRTRGQPLETWEVGIVKAMLDEGSRTHQDILAYFTRPTRSVNHRVISEIDGKKKFAGVAAASPEALTSYLVAWPDLDPETGLSARGDELLIKAREAMIAAVHTFNGAGLTFRAELFITTAVIAWTYLMHAFYRRENVDYRYRGDDGAVALTKEGAEKFWELGRCLREAKCPLSQGVKANLEFLLDLRHEIEHRSTSRIDDAVGAKLQACCINFNDALKAQFGARFGLEVRLPLALQFVTFDTDQTRLLKRASSLPKNVEAMMANFDKGMSDEERGDAAFAYRVAFVPVNANRASSADEAIRFVKPGSDEAQEVTRVLFKEVVKTVHTATAVVNRMKAEGYPTFTKNAHVRLWKALDAKKPSKGFGKPGTYAGSWEWFDSWIARVRQHCAENAGRYGHVVDGDAGGEKPPGGGA